MPSNSKLVVKSDHFYTTQNRTIAQSHTALIDLQERGALQCPNENLAILANGPLKN